MHRAAYSLLPVFVLIALATFGTHAIVASDTLLHLTGWAEIPSTYRHPGPVSGQFTTGPVNGVTPPYTGQPIPGFSGMIPGPTADRFYALPDNGFGAQTNSADFVIGFYVVTPWFKTDGDGTTSRGPVTVHGFTPFSDPHGYLSASYITDGPVYARTSTWSRSRGWTTARSGWARSSARTCCTSTRKDACSARRYVIRYCGRRRTPTTW
jgi:hypothetical protein